MKILPVFFLILVLASGISAAGPVLAGAMPDPALGLPDPPVLEPRNADGSRCFALVNEAPYSITGSVNTNYYETADGTRARANRNFRLAPGERQEICSNGPFYSGDRLELVLRTLIPLFSCYTVAQGDILIHGIIKPEGGTETWADCQ